MKTEVKDKLLGAGIVGAGVVLWGAAIGHFAIDASNPDITQQLPLKLPTLLSIKGAATISGDPILGPKLIEDLTFLVDGHQGDKLKITLKNNSGGIISVIDAKSITFKSTGEQSLNFALNAIEVRNTSLVIDCSSKDLGVHTVEKPIREFIGDFARR